MKARNSCDRYINKYTIIQSGRIAFYNVKIQDFFCKNPGQHPVGQDDMLVPLCHDLPKRVLKKKREIIHILWIRGGGPRMWIKKIPYCEYY